MCNLILPVLLSSTSVPKALLNGFNDQEAIDQMLIEQGGVTGEDKIQVQLGTMKTTVLVKENSCDLYLWGAGDRGRLGHKEDSRELQPRVVDALLGHNIVMLACGAAHTMALGGVCLCLCISHY